MSSIVMGNGGIGTTTTKAGNGAASSLSVLPPSSQKRKFSQDGGLGEAVSAGSVTVDCSTSKRIKCSHPAASAESPMATNTILITNNYGKNSLAPTSTTTSNSSQITILAQHEDDDDVGHPDRPPGLHRRPMVVDQINICINNHFSGDAPPALITTATASATAKLPELIKIQKSSSHNNINNNKQKPKLGYEAEVKEEEQERDQDELLDVEQAVQGFTIKKEPLDDVHAKDAVVAAKVTVKVTKEEAFENKNKSLKMKSKHFSIGEEVLVPRKALLATADARDSDSEDSCFYLGILTVVRGDQCLVQFEDGTNCWAGVAEIKRILRQPNTIYCVVCKTREVKVKAKNSNNNKDDEGRDGTTTIHDCLRCGRVYHEACLARELGILRTAWRGDAKVMDTLNAKGVNCLR